MNYQYCHRFDSDVCHLDVKHHLLYWRPIRTLYEVTNGLVDHFGIYITNYAYDVINDISRCFGHTSKLVIVMDTKVLLFDREFPWWKLESTTK